MHLKTQGRLAALLGLVVIFAGTQSSINSIEKEQSLFGIESPIDRPVPVPPEILRLLDSDVRVVKCLGIKGIRQAPGTWYTTSEIHLNDRKQADFVVLPKEACLFGANIGPIWVFGRTEKSFEILLKTDALGIEILKSKTNGFRDIKGVQATAIKTVEATFKYDGHRYVSVQPENVH